MIQRIQTIYLLVAAILMALSYAFDVLIGFTAPQSKLYTQLSMFGATGQAHYSPTALQLIMPVAAGLAIALQCWGIFAFSNLKRQARIVLLSTCAIAVFYAQLAYEFFFMKQQLAGPILPYLGAVLPVVSLVFVVMAWRAIRRDYQLIRSVDRIR
ncbi:MAG: DUF4293 domain-containing protein [Bacteroidales bacterium]|nr:DUF4293 domain-containing protein [Bacteroidales bacterium]